MRNHWYSRTAPVMAAASLLISASAGAQDDRPMPRKYVGPPTVAEITAGDLMTRVYKFADDSMMGSQVGTPYNDMGTAYIESEVRRLGLQPQPRGVDERPRLLTPSGRRAREEHEDGKQHSHAAN